MDGTSPDEVGYLFDGDLKGVGGGSDMGQLCIPCELVPVTRAELYEMIDPALGVTKEVKDQFQRIRDNLDVLLDKACQDGLLVKMVRTV